MGRVWLKSLCVDETSPHIDETQRTELWIIERVTEIQVAWFLTKWQVFNSSTYLKLKDYHVLAIPGGNSIKQQQITMVDLLK